jgi:hypothetical protein
MKLFRKTPREEKGMGLIIFNQVSDVFKAEKVLKRGGYEIVPVAPPMKYRRGCDLALKFELVFKVAIERSLKIHGIAYLEIIALNEDIKEFIKIIQTKDFGSYIMIKAGNMKISFHKETGEIVNVSGGGCPDVPYLHACLLGKRLDEANPPKDTGYTLCAMMLQMAFDEALSIWKDKYAFNSRYFA